MLLAASPPLPDITRGSTVGVPVTTGPTTLETSPDPVTPEQAAPLTPADPLVQTDPLVVLPPTLLVQPPQLPGASNDIIVEGRDRTGDPLEPANVQSFAATQAVDKAFVGPVARAYAKALPSPIRNGLRNFLANLREPVVAVNYLLQLKPGKAGETLGRFAINSTVGAAGLFDFAKRRPINLPRRRNGFANTLGYYGVKPGPFFYLPLIGPTTLRDLFGNGIDQAMGPIGMLKPFNQAKIAIPIAVLSALDYRAEFDEEVDKLRASRDPYAATRKYYLDNRQAEIDALRSPRRTAPTTPVLELPPKSDANADLIRVDDISE